MNFRRVVIIGLLLLSGGWSTAPGGEDTVARELILSQGCLGCHAINQPGGTLGVELKYVGQRLTADEIRQKLLYPAAKLPRSAMPDSRHLSVAEINALVNYLTTLK
ncbi:MAG: cytochrome c [Desulfuromonadales bacterium]|nr:cytochrome c [Desulfuromonadales bacterium]MDT8422241.1 cytochrome c [Desulfuromonadales bacterium]